MRVQLLLSNNNADNHGCLGMKHPMLRRSQNVTFWISWSAQHARAKEKVQLAVGQEGLVDDVDADGSPPSVERLAEHGWKPHQTCVAQKQQLQASAYRHMRKHQGSTISSNPRFQTVLFQQYSANLSIVAADDAPTHTSPWRLVGRRCLCCRCRRCYRCCCHGVFVRCYLHTKLQHHGLWSIGV